MCSNTEGVKLLLHCTTVDIPMETLISDPVKGNQDKTSSVHSSIRSLAQ